VVHRQRRVAAGAGVVVLATPGTALAGWSARIRPGSRRDNSGSRGGLPAQLSYAGKF
jgi:hypothetical protein